jgi:hypothetical protein
MFCLRCFSKLGDAATEAGSNRSFRDTDHLGNLPQAEAENVMEYDRLALLDRQRSYRPHQGRRVCSRGSLSRAVQRLGITPSLGSQQVAGTVHCNLRDPGGKRPV